MAIHDVAARFYREQLAASWVPGYLARRGIGTSAQRRWLTGYAPARPGALVRHLRAAGYPDALILAAGLARRSRRGYLTDTFRDRAMLPISSPGGTIVAFIGRAAERANPDVPKYLNSPGTCLYDKSQALFGLWQARDCLTAGAIPVITEGPLDAIAIAIASEGNAEVRAEGSGPARARFAPVALCGSALTAHQVSALATAGNLSATGVIVAFDDDAPGRRAAVRAYHLLSPHAAHLSAVDLSAAPDSPCGDCPGRDSPTSNSPGRDPAQILRDEGPAALVALLTRRLHPLADLVVDAQVGHWSPWLDFAEGQIGALRAAAGVVAAMRPPEVGRQVARLAARLDLDYGTVTAAVTDALERHIQAGAQAPHRDINGLRHSVGGPSMSHG